MGGVGGNLPALIFIPGGIIFFIISLALYFTTIFEGVGWKSKAILLLGIFALTTLGILYHQAHLIFQLPLFLILAVALLIGLFHNTFKSAWSELLFFLPHKRK